MSITLTVRVKVDVMKSRQFEWHEYIEWDFSCFFSPFLWWTVDKWCMDAWPYVITHQITINRIYYAFLLFWIILNRIENVPPTSHCFWADKTVFAPIRIGETLSSPQNNFHSLTWQINSNWNRRTFALNSSQQCKCVRFWNRTLSLSSIRSIVFSLFLLNL